MARVKIKRKHTPRPADKGMTQFAKVTGIILLVILVLMFVLYNQV